MKSTYKQVNARLLKTYGITLDEYNLMLHDQDKTCAICDAPPKSKSLHVDHDHTSHKVKVKTERSGDGWQAHGRYKGAVYFAWGRKKPEAIKEVRLKIRKASVRGLLCWKCNTGLQKWHDDPVLMEKASAYIRKFNAKES